MKFGVFDEHQLLRPWARMAEKERAPAETVR
jgi:hypothetical protein